ncbi:tyrosine-type recombinase/integrase [Paenibacillus sp. LMG 31461]|uniref:Tyrosine-type recombinase/integrase n=1 Tax=Paenibacillus plantarum TaxID=2654975 RepID=A0ABX1X4H4_9BACL|nr:site-specific integrase [Paenibacillus plantarum]NOU63167.1 tyrosine-type recombinase/integrase [Paenibacillus plantarum]
MNFVQPIRDQETIDAIKEFLMKRSHRNYMMFVLGINTGLRIQDILKLRVRDVNGEYLVMTEMKTDKRKIIEINPLLKREIKRYTAGQQEDDYLFPSRQGGNRPIKRDMAYKIMKTAAKKFGLVDIGTHTLRKTFGYHMYQKTKDITLVQTLLNHSDKAITMRYIGMDQDTMNAAMRRFGL